MKGEGKQCTRLRKTSVPAKATVSAKASPRQAAVAEREWAWLGSGRAGVKSAVYIHRGKWGGSVFAEATSRQGRNGGRGMAENQRCIYTVVCGGALLDWAEVRRGVYAPLGWDRYWIGPGGWGSKVYIHRRIGGGAGLGRTAGKWVYIHRWAGVVLEWVGWLGR